MGIEDKLKNSNLRVLSLQNFKAPKIAAVTEALHSKSKEATLAFFQWEPSITLSYNQSIDDVDLELAKKNNYSVVRMLGGGRAYIHNNDVSFLLIIPGLKDNFSLKKNYEYVACKFINAFNGFGLKAELKDDRKYGFDIYVNNQILMGLAQHSLNDCLLIHGAFYYSKPDYDLAIKLIKGYDEKDAEILKKNVGYFAKYSNAKLTELLEKIIESFSPKHHLGELSIDEKKSINDLAKKYEDFKYTSAGSQNRGLCWLPKSPYPLPGTFKD